MSQRATFARAIRAMIYVIIDRLAENRLACVRPKMSGKYNLCTNSNDICAFQFYPILRADNLMQPAIV